MTISQDQQSEPTAQAARRASRSRAWSSSVSRRVTAGRLTGIVAAIIVTGVVFQTQNSFFMSSTNLLELVRSMTPLAILAFGETFVLVSGEIDLSLGSIYGLGAMTAGQLWIHGMPFWLAGLCGLGVGGGVGFINAFLVTVVGVNSFVTTLGTLNLAQGATYLISHSSAISPSNNLPGFNLFNSIGNTNIIGQIPVQVAWLVGVGIVMWVLLHRSLFGFRLAAIGGNPAAARAAHLPIRRYKFWAFGLAGVCAALGGLIDFSLVGSTDPSSGQTLTFPVFAAVIIGGASLSGGRGSIIGTVIGALLLEALSNGLTLIGVGTFAQLLFVGGIIIAAVAVDRWTSRIRRRVDVQI
jgi:ribose/xylose/arabinose/galactoside ABC-type transport system permease subunit